MSEGNGKSSVNIVAIVAVLVLVGGAAWFMLGRPGTTATTTRTSAQPEQTGIHVKVNLPDSVTIK